MESCMPQQMTFYAKEPGNSDSAPNSKAAKSSFFGSLKRRKSSLKQFFREEPFRIPKIPKKPQDPSTPQCFKNIRLKRREFSAYKRAAQPRNSPFFKRNISSSPENSRNLVLTPKNEDYKSLYFKNSEKVCRRSQSKHYLKYNESSSNCFTSGASQSRSNSIDGKSPNRLIRRDRSSQGFDKLLKNRRFKSFMTSSVKERPLILKGKNFPSKFF